MQRLVIQAINYDEGDPQIFGTVRRHQNKHRQGS